MPILEGMVVLQVEMMTISHIYSYEIKFLKIEIQRLLSYASPCERCFLILLSSPVSKLEAGHTLFLENVFLLVVYT